MSDAKITDIQNYLQAFYSNSSNSAMKSVKVDISEIDMSRGVFKDSSVKVNGQYVTYYFDSENVYVEAQIDDTKNADTSTQGATTSSSSTSTSASTTNSSKYTASQAFAATDLETFSNMLVRLSATEMTNLLKLVQNAGKPTIADWAKDRFGTAGNDGEAIYVYLKNVSNNANKNTRDSSGNLDYAKMINELYDAINSINTDEEKINQILCDTSLTDAEIQAVKNKYYEKFGISLNAHLLKTYNSNWDRNNIIFYNALLNENDDSNSAKYTETNESAIVGGFANKMIIETTIDGCTITCKFNVKLGLGTGNAASGERAKIEVNEIKIKNSTKEHYITDETLKDTFLESMQLHDTENLKSLLEILKLS